MVVSLHLVVGNWILGPLLTSVNSAHSVPACSSSLRYILLYVSTLQLSLDTPEEGEKYHYGWLWLTMWLLGFELRTFSRAVGALTHWASSPALPLFSYGGVKAGSVSSQCPGDPFVHHAKVVFVVFKCWFMDCRDLITGSCILSCKL